MRVTLSYLGSDLQSWSARPRVAERSGSVSGYNTVSLIMDHTG